MKNTKNNKILLFIVMYILNSCVSMPEGSNPYAIMEKEIISTPDIIIKKPVIQGYPDSSIQKKINQDIEAIIDTFVNYYLDDSKEYPNDGDVNFRSYYKIYQQSDRYLSLGIIINYDWNGPVPVSYIETFNYDFKLKTKIDFEQLINDSEQKVLIIKSNEKLNNIFEENECIIYPTVEKIKKIGIGMDTLIINFNQTEIDRHCEHPEVKIPFSELPNSLIEKLK